MVEENVVEEVVFAGVAGSINDIITALVSARDAAEKLEGGLDTKADIRKTSVIVRDLLIGASKDARQEFGAVIAVRDNLMDSVEDIQKKNKVAALKKKMEEDAKALAELEG